jgi:hypothetical protein
MPAAGFEVVRTPAFDALAADYSRHGYAKIEDDLAWIAGRLKNAPEQIGDHVTALAGLPLPVFKTRCKDSTHGIGSSGGWRIYYAIRKEPAKVFLLFLHHKSECENPARGYLLQKMEQAMRSNPPKK